MSRSSISYFGPGSALEELQEPRRRFEMTNTMLYVISTIRVYRSRRGWVVAVNEIDPVIDGLAWVAGGITGRRLLYLQGDLEKYGMPHNYPNAYGAAQLILSDVEPLVLGYGGRVYCRTQSGVDELGGVPTGLCSSCSAAWKPARQCAIDSRYSTLAETGKLLVGEV